MQWFRMYIDILDDPKVAKMSSKTFKLMLFLFAYCTELNKNNDQNGVSFGRGFTKKNQFGVLSVTKDKPNWRFRWRKRDFEKSLKELEELKIVSVQDDKIHILNYSKRQFKSDHSTDRVRRFRNKTVTGPEQNRTETKRFTESEDVSLSANDSKKNHGTEKKQYKGNTPHWL